MFKVIVGGKCQHVIVMWLSPREQRCVCNEEVAVELLSRDIFGRERLDCNNVCNTGVAANRIALRLGRPLQEEKWFFTGAWGCFVLWCVSFLRAGSASRPTVYTW